MDLSISTAEFRTRQYLQYVDKGPAGIDRLFGGFRRHVKENLPHKVVGTMVAGCLCPLLEEDLPFLPHTSPPLGMLLSLFHIYFSVCLPGAEAV